MTSVLGRGEWPASRPSRITRWESAPGTLHCIWKFAIVLIIFGLFNCLENRETWGDNAQNMLAIFCRRLNTQLLRLKECLFAVASLRHCATSRKVAGSIPDVTGFFSGPNLSSRTMALGSTQPLREISTRNLPGVKGWPAHKADNLTAVCEPICLENVGASTSQLYGPPRPVTRIA
jgi:hypothetical protein